MLVAMVLLCLVSAIISIFSVSTDEAPAVSPFEDSAGTGQARPASQDLQAPPLVRSGQAEADLPERTPTEATGKIWDFTKPVSATLRAGEVLVDGVPLAQVDIEAWPLEPLRDLRRSIQLLQSAESRRFLSTEPTEQLFVRTQEYTAERLWHTDTVYYYSAIKRSLPDGSEEAEYGYVAVPEELAPDAYVLRDAVVRTYRAPAFSDYLMAEGQKYSDEVLKKHPDATVDITEDLTRWMFFDSDGQVVGSLSHPRDGND